MNIYLNMAKYILLITSLFLFFNANGRRFNKKYFKKATWVCRNADSAFFKADTIKLIIGRFSEGEWSSGKEKYYYISDEDVNLYFYKRKKMKIWQTSKLDKPIVGIHSILSQLPGNWTWNIDGKNFLVISCNDKLIYSFKPIAEKVSDVVDPESGVYPTTLTLVRNKLP